MTNTFRTHLSQEQDLSSKFIVYEFSKKRQHLSRNANDITQICEKETTTDNCQLRGDCLVIQQLSLHPLAVKHQSVSNNFDKTLVVLNFLPLWHLKKSINGTAEYKCIADKKSDEKIVHMQNSKESEKKVIH